MCLLEEQDQLDLVLSSYVEGTLEFEDFRALRKAFQGKLVMDDRTGEVFVLGCDSSVVDVIVVDTEWIAAIRTAELAAADS